MVTRRTSRKSSSKRGRSARKTSSGRSSRKSSSSRSRSSSRSSSAKKSTSRGRGKVGKVMHEYKHGELKSGSGRSVKSRKQAIAIGLSEARRSGQRVPPKKKSSSRK